MILVKVKNKSERAVTVPLSLIAERTDSVVEHAEPGEESSCVFFPPQTSQQVQDAVLLWAEQNNVDIDISFSAPGG